MSNKLNNLVIHEAIQDAANEWASEYSELDDTFLAMVAEAIQNGYDVEEVALNFVNDYIDVASLEDFLISNIISLLDEIDVEVKATWK